MKKRISNMLRILAVVAIMAMSATSLVSGVAYAYAPSHLYIITNSPFTVGETDCDMALAWDAQYGELRVAYGGAIWSCDEVSNIDCAIYALPDNEGPMALGNSTVYYEHGQKDVVDSIMAGAPFNGSCVVYTEDLFTVSGGVYTYQGNPSGWSVTPGREETPTIDPPTITMYISEPESGNRSICMIPPFMPEWEGTNGSTYTFATWNQSEETPPNCSAWGDIWDSGVIIFPMPFYYVGTGNSEMMGISIMRLVLPFNTSDIPDDAIITGVYLRCPLYTWFSDNESEQYFTIGGAHLPSLPLLWGGEEGDLGNYSEAGFYGNYGEFGTSDLPMARGEVNVSWEVYWDTALNRDGLDAINLTGLTGLSMRANVDIDKACPDTATYIMYLPSPISFEGLVTAYPNCLLVVDWHTGGSEEPIIPTGPVSAMMVVLGLVCTFGGLMGIMIVIFRGETLALDVKVGVLTGLVIFTVIGVAILQAIIVAVTR